MATLSPLIGRAEELGLVEKLVQEHRLVTVTGAAGVGKTRLVEELRAQLAAAGDRVIPVRARRPPGRRRGRGDRRGGGDELARSAGPGHHGRADRRRARRLRPRARRRGGPRPPVLRGHRRPARCSRRAASPSAWRASGWWCSTRSASRPPPTLIRPPHLRSPSSSSWSPPATPGGTDPTARCRRSPSSAGRSTACPLAIELAAARARTLSPTELLALVTQRTDTLRPPGGRPLGRAAEHRLVDRAVGRACSTTTSTTSSAGSGVLTGAFDLGLVHAVAGPGRRRPPPGGGAGGRAGRPVARRRRAVDDEHPLPDAPGRARARARRPDRRGPRRGDPGAPGVGDGRRGDRHPRRGQPAVVRRAHRAHHHPRRQLHRLARVVHRARRRPRAAPTPSSSRCSRRPSRRPRTCRRSGPPSSRAGRRPPRPSAPKRWR